MTRRRPWTHLREELRQRRHHRAFRIAPGSPGSPEQDYLQRLLADPSPVEVPPGLDDTALAAAVTKLWNAQRRLAVPGDDSAARARQAGRYLRDSRDVLTAGGLLVQDHDGDAFHPGRSVEALAYEDDPCLTTETVLRTVRPSIYLADRRIQMAQVIVGRPVVAADAQPDPNQERSRHA